MESRDHTIHINLQCTNLPLTHELRTFVYKKLNDCLRALGETNPDAIQINIEIERTTSRHPRERNNGQLYRAEANVKVPGQLIRAEESSMHLEPAIVKMKNTLTRNLRHWRERRIDRRRDGARFVKSFTFQEEQTPMMIADEWEEPSASSSPYADMFEPDFPSALLNGVHDDTRDLI